MRIFILSFVGLILALSAPAQDRYLTRQGYISFFSHTPVEDIKAENHQVLSIIDLSTGNVAVTMLMKSFEFEKALMQEHFNENYVESDKFPKSKFEGKITNLDDILSEDTNVATVRGQLTIHGVTNPVTIEGKLEVTEKTILFEGSFMVTVADYKIKIPSVVARNIAKDVKVTCVLEHKPYE